LHDAEQPQRPVDAQPDHPQAAEQGADHRRPQPGMLGDQADVGLGEAHVEVERRGQRGAQAVAELVEEDEAEHQRCTAPALAADEFVEGFGDRLAQRLRARP
jgi:hypothetical protein